MFLFQISPLTKEEEGSYECHATNSKGEASAVGAIHLVESIDDIIIKKGNDNDSNIPINKHYKTEPNDFSMPWMQLSFNPGSPW